MTERLASSVAAGLAAAGTRVLFGVPGGGSNLDVVGAAESAGLRFVLAHGETAAAMMATAHAELTRTAGACVVTRGPGAASVVNGAAEAQLDRQPLIVLCDAVDDPRIAHQRIDQRALFAPVTKWSTALGSADPDTVMRTALQVAAAAPPGSVHVDVSAADAAPAPATVRASGDMAEVNALLRQARRPAVLLGVGARDHARAVREMLAGTGIPALTTYKARGIVPDSGPNAAGTLTGARADAPLLRRADLVVAIGVDSVELIPGAWDYPAPVVSLAEWPDTYAYLPVTVTVVGALDELLPRLTRLPDSWPEGFAAGFRRAAVGALLDGPVPAGGLAPWTLVHSVHEAAPPHSIATVDAGAHMLAVMSLWSVDEPGQLLISSGLATMGYALPAAIGAALAVPGGRVYCFVGDGGLGMTLAELETLARLHLPVTVVVFNDGALSLVRVKQRPSGHGGPRAVEYSPIDFAEVASAMGVRSARVADVGALCRRLSEVDGGPMLLDVLVDTDSYRHVLAVTRG